jgi:site-specific DNA-methyltransferase (adenine-specific)
MSNRVKRKHHDSWQTPGWLYTALDHEFDFDLDPCPLDPKWSPKRVAQGLSVDGLAMDWSGHRVFCNPPYSDKNPWVLKALEHKAQVVVLVPPASTASEWFQLLRDYGAELRFFRKRVKFWKDGNEKAKQSPTNGTLVAVVRAGNLIVIVIVTHKNKTTTLQNPERAVADFFAYLTHPQTTAVLQHFGYAMKELADSA